MAAKEYYILDARNPVGNCAVWWRHEAQGYTCELGDAGLFTLDYASSLRAADIPVHRSIAEEIAVKHVRWEPLHERGAGIHQAQCGTAPKLMPPVPGWEPPPGAHTAEELVAGCNDLAREFYGLMGHTVPEGYEFYKATHPQEQLCWTMAATAFEALQATSMDDVLSEIDDD